MTRRRRARSPKPQAQMIRIDALKAQADQTGVPMHMPTQERAERGDLVIERITGYQFEADAPGRKAPRRVTMGVAIKDKACEAKTRLKRFRDLSPEQIAAGVRLETDWEAAGLEPRVVANLMGTGGGSHGGSVAGLAIDARTRVHLALQAIRLGGPEVVRVIEAVVIQGATSTEVGSMRYSDAARGTTHVTALLGVGLNLLSAHYGLRPPRK